MKKILLASLTLVATMLASAAESVPYSSDLGINYNLDPAWSQAKRSGKYWEYDRNSNFSTPGTSGGMMHTWESDGAADAMLISPAITLSEGKSYTVSFWAKTQGNTSNEHEAFKLYMGATGSFDDLKATSPLIEKSDYFNNDDFEKFSHTFTAASTSDAYFGILCCSEYYQGNLCVTGFSIHEGEASEEPELPEVVVEIPYTADFSTIAGFKEWSSLAGPEAGTNQPWSYNSYSKYPEFDRSYELKEDNYFISPALNVTESGVYAVEIGYTAFGTFDLMLGTDNADPASFNQVLLTIEDATDFNELAETTFSIATPGKYYIAMHLRADEGSYMGYRLHSFKVKNNIPVPALISDLKATADPTDALSVELTWTNPALTHLDTPLSSITKIEIERNGELVATLTDNLTPGAAASYTDTPSAAGTYSYTAVAYGENGASDATPIPANAGYVGHPTALFPYSLTINAGSLKELEKFTTLDADGDGLSWGVEEEYSSIYMTSEGGPDASIHNVDNYLASPYIHLEPGYYRFTSSISAHANNFETGIATNRHDIAATFTPLAVINDCEDFSFNEYTTIVPIDAEGDYCLVWHHFGQTSNYVYHNISLQSAKLTSQVLLPGEATNLDATSKPGTEKVTLTWTNPAVDNARRPLLAISKAEIKRDDTLIATITDGLTPGEQSSYNDLAAESGEHTYSVVIYNDNGCSEAAAPTVTLYVGYGREIPYIADFNEWTIANRGSYTTWAVDGSGAAIFERGTYDDVVYDDDIISPYLYLEEDKHYTLKFTTLGATPLSDGEFILQAGPSPDRLSDIYTVSHTGEETQNHTVNLEVPAGNIVLAFHVFKNIDAIISDLKVEENRELNSLSEIKMDSATFTNGIIHFAAGTTDVIVADTSGHTLFSADSAPAQLNLQKLGNRGILIIRATSPDGTPLRIKIR